MADIGDMMAAAAQEQIELDGFRTMVDQLTKRERQVFARLIEGDTSEEAAIALGLSRKTAEVHRNHILSKLKMKNTARMTRLATKAGF